ncbi:RNase adapter RapZ [Sinisalibacter aestuarii]|uniref:Nucleotide-binding protein n=1 Tax=Sinisalibacter aestuarii TaxID=2949426 RepID=A0ABQ5LWA2_9RHOB|nr:RNase adapter RapZ [Sinisalibacter aestuarii]GKY89269.1 nucleotide-binding protein [Sinisalibacter aestuarii]
MSDAATATNGKAKRRPQHVVLVTGPSGAGRTTAIRALEDFGYEVIDNLPMRLIPRVLAGGPVDHPLALGIDVRTRGFSAKALAETIDALQTDPRLDVELLYLDCRPDVLSKRYSETRRRHPLSGDENPIQGIAREIELLAPVRARADILIDTSDLTIHDLKSELLHWIGLDEGDTLSIAVQSFSYKRGVPHGLDLVFDVRFLRNPHWEADLRPLTGKDEAVRRYVAEDPRFDEFLDRVTGLIAFLLPAYAEEGKAHLSIGFGCTGGRHRSVTLAETVAKGLATGGWRVSIRHRELEAPGGTRAPEIHGGRTV